MAIINATVIEEPVTVDGQVSTQEVNQTAFQVQTSTVVTAGTPVQGPSIAVPFSVAVAVQNDPNNGSNDILYIANSSANTAIPANRMELRRGQSIALYITNVNLLWFDSNSNGVDAKILVEA